MAAIHKSYQQMKDSLKRKINDVDFVCATCDVWSSRSQSYLGMTIHFLTEQLAQKSYLLAFRQLESKQTHQELADEMVAIFNECSVVAASNI